MPVPFTKPWLSYKDQLALLQVRGLAVGDQQAAEHFLSHVNYYRFSGYCLAFENAARHTFAPGTTFEQVRASYDFDFGLRDLLCEALEMLEVDLRTAVAHHFGRKYGTFGHIDIRNFFNPSPSRSRGFRRQVFQHDTWIEKLREEARRSKELFVTHFSRKYSNFPDLPIWVVTEVMSFGSLSLMIQGMKSDDQRDIATRYGIQPSILASWTHHLSVVRNLCAHHARLWDRLWPIRPELPPSPGWRPPHLIDNTRLSVTLLILYQLLKRCPAAAPFPTTWRARVNSHLAAMPAAHGAAGKLGLSSGWGTGPLWQ